MRNILQCSVCQCGEGRNDDHLKNCQFGPYMLKWIVKYAPVLVLIITTFSHEPAGSRSIALRAATQQASVARATLAVNGISVACDRRVAQLYQLAVRRTGGTSTSTAFWHCLPLLNVLLAIVRWSGSVNCHCCINCLLYCGHCLFLGVYDRLVLLPTLMYP